MTPAMISAGYAVLAVVSEGSFGTVLKASRRQDHTLVALKVVPKHRLSDKECTTIRKQVCALRMLRHRYIVEFLDDFEDSDYFYHVFEFLNGGDLYDRLEARGKPFSEAQVLFLARQIFYAVSFLHSKRAAHRDLKLENFVFETRAHDERQMMKLIDFDLLVMRSKQSPRTETCSDMCGTILYVSPEIAAGREHVPEESDMWACGVMLYVLLSYQMPFQGATGRQILRAVRCTEPYFGSAAWSDVSSHTKALVRDLLNKNAAERPTSEQALERVKSIQASIENGGSSSRLRALTRGLRSVSLNIWDGSGQLVRRVGRHGTVDSGNRRGTLGVSGQLNEMILSEEDRRSAGGKDETNCNGDMDWMGCVDGIGNWGGSGQLDHNGVQEGSKRRHNVRIFGRDQGCRRIRSQLRQSDENESIISMTSGTGTSSTAVARKAEGEAVVIKGNGRNVKNGKVQNGRDCYEKCNNGYVGAGSTSATYEDSGKSDGYEGNMGIRNDTSAGNAPGDGHGLRCSRRLRKGRGNRLGARIRQWMHKA